MVNQTAIENLRTYLRIPSVHPHVDYEPCVNFLRAQAEEIGLSFSVCRPIKNKPVAVLTWIGKEPSLPSIMLNSHMDVVPVVEESWSHKPFGAEVDENGNIYARGIQDTKALGIQYLEAVRQLKQAGYQPKRTVHITFVPDEEIGGLEGMVLFIKTPEFKALNVGFAMDEGIASENDTSSVFYGEKRGWTIEVHCTGQSGHGSLLLDNTAVEKAQIMLRKLYEFRAEEKKLHSNDHVVTLNVTMINGGVQSNVIPQEITLVVDNRVPMERFATFEAQMKAWCKEAGSGVTIKDLLRGEEVPHTSVDGSNPFWVAFKKALTDMNISVQTQICSANGDGRYLRSVGVPTIGYSPGLNTPPLYHGHNEFLNTDEFLRGIDKFTNIIPAITNV